MKTDHELLELAARAAGYEVDIEENWIKDELPYFHLVAERGRCWRPLTDDGDALRLAVKLRFSIKDFAPHDEPGIVQSPPNGAPIGMIEIWRELDDDPIYVEWYKNGFDREAATRRAIVRAAAEIGEAK